MNDKYVVFKREEWEDAMEPYISAQRSRGYPVPLPDEVDDGVVMRRQDVFAAPAFRIYANSIAASMVVAAKLVVPGLHLTNERLSEIAAYFERQAELSEREDRKVPD